MKLKFLINLFTIPILSLECAEGWGWRGESQGRGGQESDGLGSKFQGLKDRWNSWRSKEGQGAGPVFGFRSARQGAKHWSGAGARGSGGFSARIQGMGDRFGHWRANRGEDSSPSFNHRERLNEWFNNNRNRFGQYYGRFRTAIERRRRERQQRWARPKRGGLRFGVKARGSSNFEGSLSGGIGHEGEFHPGHLFRLSPAIGRHRKRRREQLGANFGPKGGPIKGKLGGSVYFTSGISNREDVPSGESEPDEIPDPYEDL